MAKRFRDTGVWKKKWIRELNPDMKLFWFYILDNTDHAGIWDVDIELASFQIGVKLDEVRILKVFHRKIFPLKDGKWFIPKFIDYQYGQLNEANRAHLSVINILKKYGLLNKGLPRALKQAKAVPKVKSKVKVKVKSKEAQLEEIKSNIPNLQNDFPEVNGKIEYDKFADYLEANGKAYKNYNAGFRNWLRNDSFGKAKIAPKKVVRDIDVICTECKYCFKQKSGLLNNTKCPKCNEFGVVDAITYNLMKGPGNGG